MIRGRYLYILRVMTYPTSIRRFVRENGTCDLIEDLKQPQMNLKITIQNECVSKTMSNEQHITSK